MVVLAKYQEHILLAELWAFFLDTKHLQQQRRAVTADHGEKVSLMISIDRPRAAGERRSVNVVETLAH